MDSVHGRDGEGNEAPGRVIHAAKDELSLACTTARAYGYDIAEIVVANGEFNIRIVR